jgi:hypothetical protein
MNSTKSKKADRASTLHPPLQDINRAATLRLGEESTSEAADLPQKRKMAAKKLVELDDSWVELQPLTNEGVAQSYYRGLGEAVHCIPGKPSTVFFRLGDQWFRITEEDVVEAYKSLFPRSEGAELEAKYLLRSIRNLCKDLGKVSWRLPRTIQTSQEGGVA